MPTTNSFENWYKEKRKLYQQFAEHVKLEIEHALEARDIDISSVTCRAKKIDSAVAKSNKKLFDKSKNKYVPKYIDPKNEMMDFAGVRIVVYVVSDLIAVSNLIENMFCVDVENSLDKADLLETDKVGYLSKHYIIQLKDDDSVYREMKCEIQIKTALQNAWAQIFHDRQYKNDGLYTKISDDILRNTNLIAGALELVDVQISELVKAYDSFLDKKDNVYYQSLLDSDITAETLYEYVIIRFNAICDKYLDKDKVMKRVKQFGIKKIRQLDSKIDDSFVNEIISTSQQITIDKLITYILIIADNKKYNSCLTDEKIKISKSSFDFLRNFIDIELICEKNSWEIEND